MWDTAGEVRINSYTMYFSGPLHMDKRVGRPAQTYLQDPGVMDNRNEWHEKVREIHASGTT